MDNTMASYISVMNHFSTDTAGGNDNVRYCCTPDDPYYYSPKFLEQVDKLESMAIERMEQKTRMGCSPPSFNLGISPEREACATPSGDITHASFQPQMGVYTDPTGSVIAADSERHLKQANKNAINVQNTPENSKELQKLAGKRGNKKGKQVVLRHQSKRILAIENETSNLPEIFKTVMDLEMRRHKWMKLDEAQLV
ncbi:hypothetical protein Cgig2_001051 [Carnegiea gigantea]|uniref:Uncharacterized protein n=1 Tax=Carnegiea gigantea TaxID=171969 RepID=A0A9Q1Q5E4_9CARY|nr:hypothetical protein Cgig2_001051 [Carnegiea gigantea]